MKKEERYAIWNRYYQKHKTEINARRKVVRESYKNKLSQAENKITELENENAELQQKWLNESYEKARLVEKWKHNGENIIQECKDIEGAKTYYEHQFTKAKEKINVLLEIIKRPYQFTAPRKIQMVKEAEQFLSEVEK